MDSGAGGHDNAGTWAIPPIASFEESRKGALAAGYLADLVMLDRDIFTIAPEEIRNVGVVMIVVGGKIVHSSP